MQFAGYLQDQEVLDTKGFKVKKYGRRAGWYILHLPLSILVTAALLMPPQKDASTFTYIWYFVMSLLGKWTHTVMKISITSAGDEIYPSQSERVQLYVVSTQRLKILSLQTIIVFLQVRFRRCDANSCDCYCRNRYVVFNKLSFSCFN